MRDDSSLEINSVPDLWGTEKMRLVLFSQQEPGPVTLCFQAGKVQKHLVIALHGIQGPQALEKGGECAATCSGSRQVFILIWPLDELRQQIHLCLIHALIF